MISLAVPHHWFMSKAAWPSDDLLVNSNSHAKLINADAVHIKMDPTFQAKSLRASQYHTHSPPSVKAPIHHLVPPC